jgi:hypothetical protein
VIPRIRPALDPLAQRAAIQALETQRAAYARYARGMDGHRAAVAAGDGGAALAATAAAEDGHRELDEGARRLAPLVEAAHAAGGDADREVLRRQVDAMMAQARAAETVIHNLTQQLEAWHAAYSRQLAETGVVAGEGGAAGGDAASGGPASYHRRGSAADAGTPVRPLIDRRG